MAQYSADLLKLNQALAAKNLARLVVNVTADEDEDEEGGGEEGGSTGEGGVTVEKRLFVEAFGLIRNGEKQFGIAHEFDQLAYLAKENRNLLNGELGQNAGNGLKNHPILSHLSKFDGDTPDMSMNPETNPDAQQRYENQLQLLNQPNNRPSSAPTLKPI